MSGIKVNTQMLALAREARGLSQIELADRINVSQSNVNRWESGNIALNEEAFVAIQKELDFPASFFFQTQELIPPAFYRKRDKVDKRTLDRIDAQVNIYRMHANKILQANSGIKTDIPVFNVKSKTKAGDIAQQLRKHWRINKGVISNLTQLIESKGVIVINFDFQTERVDGRMAMSEDKHPILFINALLLGDRQRFTLAYELGQMLMYNYCHPAFDLNKLSHEANLFAADFLLPEQEIREDFSTEINLQLLANMKKKWKVSMQALLYRADDLGLLTYNQKRYLLSQFNQLKIRRREPPELDIAREKPSLMHGLLAKYRSKQGMSVKQIAAYLHITEKDFNTRYA
jgi:Zn-dependent peptidase ImmA (M78 family)